MRLVVLQQPRQVAPFNEPAALLRVLNKPLHQWQADLTAAYASETQHARVFTEIPREGEILVISDNLWFDKEFLDTFLAEARSRQKPCRAAFRQDDPAYLQQGLRQLTRSYERRGDLYYVDMWYFPEGLATQVEPVIVASDAQEIGYYALPNVLSGQSSDLVWWLPQRAVCSIDTWVHLFFANIVFGVFTQAFRSEQKSASSPLFRFQASLRALAERRNVLGSSAFVKVGENCSIDESTVFQGPVIIGDHVTIGPGCVITQSIIGDHVTLAHGNNLHMAVVNDHCFLPWGASAYFTTLMEKASLGNHAVMDMSVIGRGSYVGSGTIFTDFNLLPIPLQVTIDGLPTDIDMPVLGVCVGHNCRVGAGLVVYPARAIESDVVLIPSPTRRVIMNDIGFEESDHHALPTGDLHPRLYPRAE